jgi:hypothetical protein
MQSQFDIKGTSFLVLSYLYKLEWQDNFDLYNLRLDFNPSLNILSSDNVAQIKKDLLSLSQNSDKKLIRSLEYLEFYRYLEYQKVLTAFHDSFLIQHLRISILGIEMVENISSPNRYDEINNQFNFKVAENITVNNSLINLDRLFEFLNTTINTFKK